MDRHACARGSRRRGLAAWLALLLAVAAPVRAADAPVHGSLTQDVLWNLHGGARRGVGAPVLAHLTLQLDGSRWGGSDDNRIYVDAMGTGGASISQRAGDLQGLDNAEAPASLRLFEAWFEHDFGSANLHLRVGLQDYNALFDNLGTADLFLNSSFGIEPTVSQAGVSIFPRTTLGATLRWVHARGLYLMGGVYDGSPRSPDDPHGMHVHLRRGDGVFAAFEGGFADQGQHPTKLGVGGWIDTRGPHPPTSPQQRNHGLYLIGETRLLGPGRRQAAVDGFVQWGSSMPREEHIDRYLGAGLRIVDARLLGRGDVLGLALARAHVRGVGPAAAAGAETVVELTLAAPLRPSLVVQPDLQYIVHPGAAPARPDAVLGGVRLRLTW